MDSSCFVRIGDYHINIHQISGFVFSVGYDKQVEVSVWLSDGDPLDLYGEDAKLFKELVEGPWANMWIFDGQMILDEWKKQQAESVRRQPPLRSAGWG